jgi:hypothetical protein
MMQIVNARRFTFVGHILCAYAILSMLSDPRIWYSNKNPFILLTKLLLAIIMWLWYWMHDIVQCSKDYGLGGHHHVSWMCTVHHIKWIRVDANSGLAWMGDTPHLGKDGAHKWRRPCLSAHGLLNAKHWSVCSIIGDMTFFIRWFHKYIIWSNARKRLAMMTTFLSQKCAIYYVEWERERQHQSIVCQYQQEVLLHPLRQTLTSYMKTQLCSSNMNSQMLSFCFSRVYQQFYCCLILECNAFIRLWKTISVCNIHHVE